MRLFYINKTIIAHAKMYLCIPVRNDKNVSQMICNYLVLQITRNGFICFHVEKRKNYLHYYRMAQSVRFKNQFSYVYI